MSARRIVPLIVAVALFMENMDSTVIATSLPVIAADIGTSPLALKLAVTSYLLSLAVFIPVSGWTADRFGARSVFRVAIAVFMIGSIGCAFSQSLTQFVAARIVEGMGGAMLPLLLQLGFDLTAFQSGLITLSNVVGAMGMKTIVPIVLRRFGFRQVLTVNALLTGALVAACATFQPGVSFAWIIGMLVVGGFFRSLEFTSLNTIAYADVDARRMSSATSLVSVGQQVSISAGVAIGALAVELTLWARGHSVIAAADFQPAFLLIGVIAAAAAVVFARLPPDAGAELARRTPASAPGSTEASDQKLG